MKHHIYKDIQDIVDSAMELKDTLDDICKDTKDKQNELNNILMIVNLQRELGNFLSEDEITELRERLGYLIIGVKHPKRLDSKPQCKK